MSWVRAALLAAFALCVSCIIIADPEIQPPEPPIEAPPDTQFVPVPFPSPGGAGMRIAQLWFVRVDPGSSALAPSYASMLAQAKAGFEASGATTVATAVFALQDARPLWAHSLGDAGAAPVSLEETLRYHAANPWDAGSPRCPTHVISLAARDLRPLRVTYPLELVPFVPPAPPDAGEDDGGLDDGGVLFADAGPITAIAHTTFPFPGDVNAVFIAVIDSGPRAFAYTDTACMFGPGFQRRTAAVEFTEGRPLSWIRNGATRFEAVQVAWMLTGTSEDAGSTAMKSRCLSYPGFPRTALDVISASNRPLFTPWSAEARTLPSVVHHSDLCQAAGGEWSFGAFVNSWASALTLRVNP